MKERKCEKCNKSLDDRSFRLSESIDIDGAFTIIANAAARAGLFLAFNASGDLTVSSGTGADAGLRTDLVSIDAGLGFHLISYEILSGELGVSSSEYPWGDIRRYDTLDNAIASCAALNIPLFQYGVNTAWFNFQCTITIRHKMIIKQGKL